jgi:hypothetical protein
MVEYQADSPMPRESVGFWSEEPGRSYSRDLVLVKLPGKVNLQEYHLAELL